MTILIRLLVLCSGLLQMSAANRLRYFWHQNDRNHFPEALKECESSGGSMATLYDKDDEDFVVNLAKSIHSSSPSYWLGLHKQRNDTTWSNGDPLLVSESTVNLKQGEQRCEAIENGTWRHFNCSDRKYFMCQEGNKYILTELNKTWCQALQHCRAHHTHLARINNTEQNEELKNKSWNQTFWIGLLHDEWRWTDNSCSTYRNWDLGKEPGPLYDFSMFSYSKRFSWKMAEGNQENLPLCTKGFVRIKAIPEPKSWECAIDYCKSHHTRLLQIEDQEDQAAVQQWLNHTSGSNYTQSFWIGLKQSSVFGFWIWSDKIVNWSNWKDGRAPEMSLSNLCGVIDAVSYKWREEFNWKQLSFLCEENIPYMDT